MSDDRLVPRAFALSLLAAIVLTGVVAGTAAAASAPAVVTRAIDGDTVVARGSDGREATVRLIGIDAPETVDPEAHVECGGPEAAAATRRLEGRTVTLTTDASQGLTDRYGRLLAYVDVDGGDVGERLVRAGLAEVLVYDGKPFERLVAYQAAQAAATDDQVGSYDRCGGNFHRAQEAADHDDDASGPTREETARLFVRRFFHRLNRHDYRRAWGMLSAGTHRRLGSYRGWRAGYRTTIGVRVNTVAASFVGTRAVVRTAFRARDRDACSGRTAAQFFRTRWVLSRAGGQWRASSITTRKVGGPRVRTSRSECPKPKPKPAPSNSSGPSGGGGSGCDPNYTPCVPNDRDYDCPELDGPYRVVGVDDQRLDGDGDGVGCQS